MESLNILPTAGRPRSEPTLVVLLGAPFTEQNYQRTGVAALGLHFKVVVIDLCPWLRPGIHDVKYTRHPYELYKPVRSLSEFEATLRSVSPSYALDFIGLGAHTRPIQQILHAIGAELVVLRSGALPYAPIKGKLSSLLRKDPKTFFLRARDHFKRRLTVPRLAPPDVALVAGRKAVDAWVAASRTLVWIGSNDYFSMKNALASNERNGPLGGAVFIDDCIALASDYELLRLPRILTPEEYYKSLNLALSAVERVSGTRITVAAHPSARRINRYDRYFGGREVVFGRTAELVANTSLALGHFSTALSYVALSRKPLIVMTYWQLRHTFMGNEVEQYSREFRCPLMDMSAGDEDWRRAYQSALKVDQGAYASYVDNYIIADGAEPITPWTALIELSKKSMAMRR